MTDNVRKRKSGMTDEQISNALMDLVRKAESQE
jgi:hypothetical protein